MNNGQEVELQRLQQAVTEAEEALNCLLKDREPTQHSTPLQYHSPDDPEVTKAWDNLQEARAVLDAYRRTMT